MRFATMVLFSYFWQPFTNLSVKRDLVMPRPLKNCLLLVCFSAFLLYSCQQEDKAKKAILPLLIQEEAMVFYYPDSLAVDSLKILFGDHYYSVSDSLTNKNSQIRGLCAAHNIKAISTVQSLLVFEVEPGVKVSIDTRRLPDFAGVIGFKPGSYPIVLSGKGFLDQVNSHFGWDDTLKHMTDAKTLSGLKKLKIPREVDLETNPILLGDSSKVFVRQADSIGWMQRLLSKFFTLLKPEITSASTSMPKAVSNMAFVSQKQLLEVFLENDIFFGTDIWYSNGVNINVVSPLWQASPVAKALIPYKGKSLNFYGLSIIQTMFTPKYPTWEGIQYDDRPFGSYLMLGHSKLSTIPDRKLRISSCLYFGVIGKYALGGDIQSFLHGAEKRPIGWANQIANDLLINYNVEVEKALFSVQKSTISILSGIKVGSLHTNASLGFRFQWSNSPDYFYDPYPRSKSQDSWNQILKKLKYSFDISSSITGVAYDASLQGGMFNKTSPYVISDERLRRFVSTSSIGVGLCYKQFAFDMSGFMISPEFDPQKRWHKWARLQVTYAF